MKTKGNLLLCPFFAAVITSCSQAPTDPPGQARSNTSVRAMSSGDPNYPYKRSMGWSEKKALFQNSLVKNMLYDLGYTNIDQTDFNYDIDVYSTSPASECACGDYYNFSGSHKTKAVVRLIKDLRVGITLDLEGTLTHDVSTSSWKATNIYMYREDSRNDRVRYAVYNPSSNAIMTHVVIKGSSNSTNRLMSMTVGTAVTSSRLTPTSGVQGGNGSLVTLLAAFAPGQNMTDSGMGYNTNAGLTADGARNSAACTYQGTDWPSRTCTIRKVTVSGYCYNTETEAETLIPIGRYTMNSCQPTSQASQPSLMTTSGMAYTSGPLGMGPIRIFATTACETAREERDKAVLGEIGAYATFLGTAFSTVAATAATGPFAAVTAPVSFGLFIGSAAAAESASITRRQTVRNVATACG